MKVVSISWLRNEEDILESFVRHHAAQLDEMIIVDNASTDSTPSILTRLQQEGCTLRVIRDESSVHRQGEILTHIMHTYADPAAWILPLDADEFLCGDLSANLPYDRVSLLPWKTYVPHATDDLAKQCYVCRIQHRKVVEHPQFHKILIPPALRAGNRISMGSHFLRNAEGEEIPGQHVQNLHLAHFPVRSAEQIYRKVHEGWQRHSANPAKRPGQNFHWERWTLELPAPQEIDSALLTHIALHYTLPHGEMADTQLIKDPVACRCTHASTSNEELSPAPLGVQ